MIRYASPTRSWVDLIALRQVEQLRAYCTALETALAMAGGDPATVRPSADGADGSCSGAAGASLPASPAPVGPPPPSPIPSPGRLCDRLSAAAARSPPETTFPETGVEPARQPLKRSSTSGLGRPGMQAIPGVPTVYPWLFSVGEVGA
jgi:hypothetical protein